MSVWQAILQGMIQGLTEFLPVSSSGHLSIFQYFTGLSGESGAFFSIVLHLGTLFAVILAFFPTIWRLICEAFAMLGDIFRGRFTFRRVSPRRKMIFLLIVSLLPLFFVVFLKDFYESFSTDDGIIVEGLCLIVTGILLTLACQCPDAGKNAAGMKYSDALAIGLAGVDFLNAPEIAHSQITRTRERAEFAVMTAWTQCNVILENPFIGVISAVCTVVGSPIGKIHINVSGNPAV